MDTDTKTERDCVRSTSRSASKIFNALRLGLRPQPRSAEKSVFICVHPWLKLFHQFHRRIGLQVARITLIRVYVDFQFETLVHAAKHFVEDDAAIAADF